MDVLSNHKRDSFSVDGEFVRSPRHVACTYNECNVIIHMRYPAGKRASHTKMLHDARELIHLSVSTRLH